MVEMDLTNRCQLKCKFCTFKYIDDRSDIDTEKAEKAIFDMAKMGVKAINFTGGGEPTLHKDFNRIVLFAKRCGLDVGLFTNGFNLSIGACDAILSSCHWVRISVDASDNSEFENIKCVKNGFSKVEDSIRLLLDRKAVLNSKTDIGVGYVITQDNYNHIYDFAKYFLKEDFRGLKYIQYKPMIDNCFEDNHIERRWWKEEVEPLLLKSMELDNRVVINYYKFNDLVSDIEREYDVCYGHSFSPCLGATGDLWVCTHLRNIDGYSFGNINTQDFEEIWKSQNREKVVKNIDISRCQKYCRNNEINKVLYQLRHGGEEGHYNFI